MTTGVIELRRRFDGGAWQLAAGHSSRPSTLLLTWTVEPEPVDAGMPPAVQAAVGEALCDLGPCWFAGDAGEHERPPVASLVLRRGLRRQRASIFRAEDTSELRAAFESGSHNWALGAQWIIVGSRERASDVGVLAVLRSVLEAWKLPDEWPDDVPAIIQAGVDGDGAGCHCRTPTIEHELRDALERRAIAHGLGFRATDW